MAGECVVKCPFKRAYKPSEGSLGTEHQYLRKRLKPSLSDFVSEVDHAAQVSQERQDSGNATSAKWRTESSERISTDSQEKSKKILGSRKFINIKKKFNFQDSDDSDEEEEQSIKKEDPKEQEGYKLTMMVLQAALLKPVA